MPAFPALSITPSVSDWSEKRAFDPTIRSNKEAGYVQTRPRFTRVPMRYEFSYRGGNVLSAADKALLVAFEGTVKVGADAFTWTNPFTAASLTMRLAAPIDYKPAGTPTYWEAKLILEQV